MKLTVSKFAKLHNINKRTLHYYDDIGLFSPQYIGENGYRYYDYRQSFVLENILMLKELHMSIDEIKQYLANPNVNDFMNLSKQCLEDIDKQIAYLQKTKELLIRKQKQIEESQKIQDQDIFIIDREEEWIFCTPVPFYELDVTNLFHHLSVVKEKENQRIGCGSYISLDKVYQHQYDEYDGFYTPMTCIDNQKDLICLEKGKYLCGYCIGRFEKIPDLYEKMLTYAKKHFLKLKGYAYEIGLNEMVLSCEDDYVTRILIRIDESKK